MTRKEIISRLGWLNLRNIDDSPDSILYRIEKLVSDAEAAEREACAKLCDEFGDEWMCDSHELSKLIRARSAT